MKNLFVTFLDQLNVRHTETYSKQYYNEHPHKNNLYGISKMLSDYGVNNVGTRIPPDKDSNIGEIQTLFIAQFSSDFVAVHQVDPENVSFVWKGIKYVLSITKFVEAWTGVVILAETTEKSIEPDYREHKQAELVSRLKKIALFASLGLIVAFAYIYYMYYTNHGISLILLVNLAGMYIAWMLLLKQMHIQSQYADKICSLFKQKDCNNVLESKAANQWGIVELSEIGFGYFAANVLLLLLFPTLINSIALLNILTLPFTLWIVWYQKVMIHKRIDDLLKQVKNNIMVQYIISSFGENLNSTNKNLIAACLEDKEGSVIQLFCDWCESGKQLTDEYFTHLSLTIANPAIEVEFQKHKAWRKKSQLRSIPTVFVNGYKLPESYKIEDLRFFYEFGFMILTDYISKCFLLIFLKFYNYED